MTSGEAALLIYIEPTPYVLGFIRHVRDVHPGPVESVFIAANVSQPWNLALRPADESFLPPGRMQAAAMIRRKLASGRYGLLHVAGWGHPLLVWATLLGWRYGIPTYMESDTQLSAGLPLWKRAFKRIFYPPLFRTLRMALPAGTRQAAYFRHYGVRDNRIVNAQMTVDVTAIATRCDAAGPDGRFAIRRALGVEAGEIVFIFVGRLEPRKGIALLLDAFQALASAREGVKLLIVGDGSERARVAAAAARDPKVRYMGRLDADAVADALCCADVAVVPSVLEPFGLVVNEAMAAGLPVIVSDRVGCADDLVRDGETGLVFPAGSVEALIGAMKRLLDSPEERAVMGRAARRLIAGWTLEEQARIVSAAWAAARAGQQA